MFHIPQPELRPWFCHCEGAGGHSGALPGLAPGLGDGNRWLPVLSPAPGPVPGPRRHQNSSVTQRGVGTRLPRR